MSAVRAHLRGLAPVGPTVADHTHALRVTVGLAVPALVLLATDRLDLIVFAVFGAVTGMYGRTETHRRRVAHQARGAALVVAGVAVGLLLSHLDAPTWVLVVTASGYAAAGSLVSDRYALKPEGPFFGIFALGAIAAVPADRAPAWPALTLCAATAATVLAMTALLGYRDDRAPATPRGMVRPVHAARYAAAVCLAGGAGMLLGVDHANWAMASAAVPLAAACSFGHVHRGVHRVVGTFAGLVVAAALLVPHPSETVLGLCVLALLFPTELFMVRHYAVALGFFTPLIMVMTDLASPEEPLRMLTYRGIDTVLGVAVGVAVALAGHGRTRTPTGPSTKNVRVTVQRSGWTTPTVRAGTSSPR